MPQIRSSAIPPPAAATPALPSPVPVAADGAPSDLPDLAIHCDCYGRNCGHSKGSEKLKICGASKARGFWFRRFVFPEHGRECHGDFAQRLEAKDVPA